MELEPKAESCNKPKPSEIVSHQKERKMTDTKNFFENPHSGGTGWGAGVGGFIGAALAGGGNGGLFGNNNAVTPDQLQATVNNLQGQMSTDAIQGQLSGIQGQICDSAAGSTAVLGAAIGGVKDAVVNSSADTQLALCNLGHNMQAGFAAVNQSILLQGAASRELALQQALDAERARATELRIGMSEMKNQSGHTATQVLLQQVVNSGN